MYLQDATRKYGVHSRYLVLSHLRTNGLTKISIANKIGDKDFARRALVKGSKQHLRDNHGSRLASDIMPQFTQRSNEAPKPRTLTIFPGSRPAILRIFSRRCLTCDNKRGKFAFFLAQKGSDENRKEIRYSAWWTLCREKARLFVIEFHLVHRLGNRDCARGDGVSFMSLRI